MSLQVKNTLMKSEQTMGQSYSWPNNLPGHIHKASAVAAVVVQAVLVYNPHIADLVLEGSQDTEDLDHPVKDLQNN